MPVEQETPDLQLRVLDLEVRIEAIEARVGDLANLADRIVVFL